MLIVLMIGALGVGVYVGLGLPGMPGLRDDRVVNSAQRRLKLQHSPLDWMKPRRTRR
jgi:hypothetical protein